ncbi:MAG TPA: exonuclease domain-containing protein [Ktedonobacteraceae bacterium]|nr:exonuclease domain-containing protein [Ktedonobacteraceae bacterium]
MGKKPPIRVALDLETTGLHAEQDTILEVAAIKFQGATVLDTLETLVAPGRSVPYRVQRLTGITPQQLIGAPQFESIAKNLQLFIGDYPLVGHSIPFDVGFLRRRGLVRHNALIDTFELAAILLPSIPSYNLGQVAEALGVSIAPGRHRAMVDTVLAMQVFLALYQRLQAVDLALLKDLANLDAPQTWPLLAFLRQELRDRQEKEGLRGVPVRGSLGDRFAAQLGMDPRILSFAIARESDTQQATPTESVEIDATVPASQKLEQLQNLVEVIPEQTDKMTPLGYRTARKAVLEAMTEKTTLLMEVTVGGSDYTPALLPVLEWLSDASSEMKLNLSPQRLLIACSNQQSARRLIETELPRLQASLRSNLPVSYLAEEGGYLCVHRWFGAALRRTSGELNVEQARGLAKQGLWAQQTLTGERSELTMLPQESSAWERMSSGYERIQAVDEHSASAYQRCVYQQKGYCFVSRAEEQVKAARIVVTTHAGLLDDLCGSHSLLASIDGRLILDADLLEEEIVRWSSVELDQTRLLGLLNTIGTELPDGRYQGLLALAAPALRENGPGGLSTTPTVGKSEVDARMRGWFQTLEQASASVSSLFGSFGQLLEEFLQHGSSGNNGGRDKGRSSYGGRNNERTDQPLRLTAETRNLGIWTNVERAWQHTTQRLQAVIELLHEAERMLITTQRSHSRRDVGTGEENSVAIELAAIVHKLEKQRQLGQQALGLASGDMVYWLRMPPVASLAVQPRQAIPSSAVSSIVENAAVPVLYGQQVQISALLKSTVLNKNAGIILAGAALSVDNNFSFCRGRFGLENDACPALSVVTEHHEQTLFYLPNDVPEPNAPQYQRNLDEALIQLATALDGQMAVLYTSHAALRSSYAAIKPVLEGRGILVLGQGVDGSPRQLWQLFGSQGKVIVLGTGNFWDSVGEVSQAPVCTFITRLPMPVLNDPPIAARVEHYSDQLQHFTVPVASLRLRKALNRIAWSDSRRNAVVLYDRRITSKEYGSTILHSLPRCSQREGAVSHMPETILDWLTASGSWE